MSIPIRVLVTGAAGQISYSLLPLLCSGLVFGKSQRLILHLLDIPQVQDKMDGLVMELKDCLYNLVDKYIPTTDIKTAFSDVDIAILVGGFPRLWNMTRKDLLGKNAPIFKQMGLGLQQYAKSSCKVLVVANPANTNCLAVSKYAPKIPKTNFIALTRLDHNRAIHQLMTNNYMNSSTCIFGNHSSTQVPFIQRPLFGHRLNMDVDSIIKSVQNRGKEIIKKRGLSSALSAANAIKDCLRDLWFGTSCIVSMGVYTKKNNFYGIKEGLFYSFPCICKNKEYLIVNIDTPRSTKMLMKRSEDELIEESTHLVQILR